ncbi:hypothetical protein V9K67_26105 [Paraflavisolibacter sp. H34]|uniref:hypothetical protein n=1 Tax=Huijunlia imazamoxiresistens TaxID=3127457 RepID=UPI00301A1415
MIISQFSQAQSAGGNNNDTEQPAMVKHIASLEDKMYFQVHFNNDSSEKFIFTIKDAQGTVLFREMYKDKTFDKKFQLNKMDENERLTFTIYTPKDKKTQSFEVNNSTRLVDDVVVTQLK